MIVIGSNGTIDDKSVGRDGYGGIKNGKLVLNRKQYL